MSEVSLGFTDAGVVPPGSHLCALYSGPDERDATLFPYLQEGLRVGDDCLCLVDGIEVGMVLDRLLEQVDAEGVQRVELRVDRAPDVYLESGAFSADRMTAFLEESVDAIAGDPSRRLRATGEMSWVLPNPPGADELFVYESAINRVAERSTAVFLCLYDLDQFGNDMIIEVLRTHPKVFSGGKVRDNPYYRSPQTSTATRSARAAGGRRTAEPDARGEAVEQHVAALAARGMTSREVVERLLNDEVSGV
jgi:hypothetical protein